MHRQILKLIYSFILVTLFSIQPTGATFTKESLISGNSITTGTWETSIPETQIVINEIMWMGSDVSTADEWIELRNLTNQEVDISNWNIGNSVTGGSGHLEIPANHKIPPLGYFLIANFKEDDGNSALNVPVDLKSTSLSLNNSSATNGQLILKDKLGNIIDQTPIASSSAWPAGTNFTTKKSMERNSTPGDGILISNWHTCEDPVCNDGTYWDISDGNNYGTPKSANHSENDLSILNLAPPSRSSDSANPQ